MTMKFLPISLVFSLFGLCSLNMACSLNRSATRPSLSPMRHSVLYQPASDNSSQLPFDMDLNLSRQNQYTRCSLNARHPLLNHCTTWQQSTPQLSSLTVTWPRYEGNTLHGRMAVARAARKLMRQSKNKSKAPAFRRDCSGFVLGVLQHLGLELKDISRIRRKGEGSVSAIFRLASAMGIVHQHKIPNIGDLVFFSNTWDRNRDGRMNDPLTHVGIVEHVDADGTITFIHHVKRGVLRYKMNRFMPDKRKHPKTGKVLNHYLRLGPYTDKPAQRLSGQLFQAFATTVF